jgi:hypothetical protein
MVAYALLRNLSFSRGTFMTWRRRILALLTAAAGMVSLALAAGASWIDR